MIPEPFEYYAPSSVAEAVALLEEHGEDSKILAGGHSLLPLMKLRLAAPKHVIDLGRVSGLDSIHESDGKIAIGAMATHYQLESSDLLKAKCPLMVETAGEIGDVQVRNKGTIGGSLAHADPAADWTATILALDAELNALSRGGERSIAAKDFFVDMLTTSLRANEILTEIRVPPLGARTGDAYLKIRHPASGFAVVGVAVRLSLDAKGNCAGVGVGVTGTAAKPYRAGKVEAALRGKAPTKENVKAAAQSAADGVDVQSDLYASEDYRAHLTRVQTERALSRAAAGAAGKK
ncbi:MAG: xanthine dehydrogenase family protein subunit M [Acidobacteria bacterium]|nr:xanthine dehydrogenase family protein subunit M [Acidobacteriota bacterium]